jgi:hypothetical protein
MDGYRDPAAGVIVEADHKARQFFSAAGFPVVIKMQNKNQE